MKITIEMIDELRSRVNVTYEEAKEALEKNDGDLVKSIIYLEKLKKNNNQKKPNKVNEKANNIWDKIMSLKLIVRKNGNTLINLPIILPLIAFIFAPWVVIPSIILALIVKCQIRIAKTGNKKDNFKKTVNDVAEKIKETAEKIIETEDSNEYEEYNNDENEITIE